MPAQTPSELHRLFVEFANAGDLQGLLSLYDEQGCIMSQAGEAFRAEGLRERLRHLLALKPVMRLETRSIVENGDVALMTSDWTLKGTQPGGDPIEAGGMSCEIARRQPDGSWRYLIDNPFASE